VSFSEPYEESGFRPPIPALTSVVGGLVLTPFAMGALLALVGIELGLASLFYSTPVCLAAIPLVVLLRNRVEFRFENALIVGAALAFAIAVFVVLVTDRAWSSILLISLGFGFLSVSYSGLAYGTIRALDRIIS